MPFHFDFDTLQYAEEQAEGRQALTGALPQLAALTHLALGCMDWLGGVPAEVGALPRLARFCWQEGYSEAPADPLLPPGAWLGSLRQLAVPLGMAAASLPRLTAATQLECLAWQPPRQRYDFEARRDVPFSTAEQRQLQLQQAAVLAWAAQHPTLCRLAIGDEAPGAVYEWRAALELALWPGRPLLAVEPHHPTFRELGCS